jgi:flagellar operon protein
MQRLHGQGVNLDAEKVDRIADGIDRAASKGSRDSLLLLDGLALVVSVKNRMVVTAISPERMREQVVTNIDSAVIL